MPAAAAVPTSTMETAAMEAATVNPATVETAAVTPSMEGAGCYGRFTRGDKGSHQGQCGQARYRRPGKGVSHQ
jgi:hypothetical protein